MDTNSTVKHEERTMFAPLVIITAIYFAALWGLCFLLGILLKASKQDNIVTAIMFIGAFIAWLFALRNLQKKNTQLLSKLLSEPTQAELDEDVSIKNCGKQARR